MPKDGKTLIMKFGGSAVQTPTCFSRIAQMVVRRSHSYPRIVIVISAMKGMTDHLIELAFQIHPNPPKREYDMLVSVGERVSIALLAMAFAQLGKEAMSFTGSQSGIMTTSNHTDAKIIGVRPSRLTQCLDQGRIAIVAGFQGMSELREITTLGRGGSDTTAVALAIALKGKVEFLKDVLGIYEQDPKSAPNARFHCALSHQQALSIINRCEKKILHPRALILAENNFLPLIVRPFFNEYHPGTIIMTPSKQRSRESQYEKE